MIDLIIVNELRHVLNRNIHLLVSKNFTGIPSLDTQTADEFLNKTAAS